MTIRFYKKSAEFGEFSNFSDHGIEMNGTWYPTVEHYFQTMKFREPGYADRIRLAPNPMQAKQLGRTRKVPIRDDWDDTKLDIMRAAVQHKFSTHEQLAELLLSTGNEELVEASPIDDFWGSGRNGDGENWLGRILMEVREGLRRAKKG